MIDFFYSLPVGLAAILVMGTSLAVGLGTSFGLRRLLGLGSSDAEMDNAVSLMQVVAAYIGILIAFAGFGVEYLNEVGGQPSIVNTYAARAFLAVGFLGGIAYWLVAGRRAGGRRGDERLARQRRLAPDPTGEEKVVITH